MRIFFYIVLFATITYVFSNFTRNTFQSQKNADVLRIVYGIGAKPYVYRALLPVTTRVINKLLPKSIKTSIAESVENIPVFYRRFAENRWDNKYATVYFIILILMYFSLAGFAFAFRYFMRSLFKFEPVFEDIFTICALVCLQPFFQYRYMYDFTTLMLFTFLLALMVNRKWKLYLIFFAIATINKETAILLPLLFSMFFHKRLPLKKYRLILGLQLILYFFIKSTISLIFNSNPGSFFEFHLWDHNYWYLSNTFSFSKLSIWLIILYMTFFDFYNKPLFLRYALLLSIPLVLLSLFMGYIEEMRGYYEIYPVIFLLIAHTFRKGIGSNPDFVR